MGIVAVRTRHLIIHGVKVHYFIIRLRKVIIK